MGKEVRIMDKTPNTWFHYDYPEHGQIEVAAHVGKDKKAKIHSIGMPGDTHVHPKHDAGMSDEAIGRMAGHASKLGEGNHMKKSEKEVAIAILNKVKELYKNHNSAHAVETGEELIQEEGIEENEVETSESDDEKAKNKKDKKEKAMKEANSEEKEESEEEKEDSEELEKCGDMKKSEKPLVAFLKKREEKLQSLDKARIDEGKSGKQKKKDRQKRQEQAEFGDPLFVNKEFSNPKNPELSGKFNKLNDEGPEHKREQRRSSIQTSKQLKQNKPKL